MVERVDDVGRLLDGRFQLEALIAATEDAVVYRASHTAIQRTVAVKLLAAGAPPDGPLAARIAREGRAAGSVAHRNVRSVVDSGADEDGRPFIVYELLEGQRMDEVLAESPDGVPIERATALVTQLLEALAAVHAGRVVHRAIGPESIWVVKSRGEDLVKLAGFHDATLLTEQAEAGPPLRPAPTPYLPAEVVRGGPYSASADLFGAGTLLRALSAGTLDGRPGLPDVVWRIIDQATASCAEERFRDADPFLHTMSLVSGGEVSTSVPPASPDGLSADLHYLVQRHKRRITRAGTMPEAPSGEAVVQLLSVLLMIEGLYKRLGGAWPELVRAVPEVEELLPGSGNTERNRQRGVPVALVSQILSTADVIAGDGRLAVVADVGISVGERVHRLAPSLPLPLQVRDVVAGFEEIWAGVSRVGEVVVLDVLDGALRLALTHESAPTVEMAAFAAGLLSGALREAGARDLRVHLTASAAVGDEATVFRASWDPF